MIYHLALATDWDAAVAAGEYRVSKLGVTLEQEGFIHASFAHQVRGVAARFYASVTEPLLLLEIDETLLTVPWRVDPVPDAPECFPHVYGPIAVSAVVAATPAPSGPKVGGTVLAVGCILERRTSSACSGVGENPNRR